MPLLTFPENYFEGEYRCGFWVTSMMKRLWASQMEILAWIDSACKKNNINYIVFYGSLLGAIRHNGYIPWDDDLDIAMLREDYNKLTEVIMKEMPDYLGTISLLPGAKQPKEMIFNIGNGSRLDTSPAFLERFHGCPYSTGVDIFVMDRIPNNPNVYKYQDELIRKIDNLLMLQWKIDDCSILGEELEIYNNLKNELEKEFDFSFNDKEAMSLQILRIMDVASSLCDDCDAKKVGNRQYMLYTGDRNYYEEYFTDRIFVPFENVLEVPVPRKYDVVLRETYGNYEVPKFNSAGHDYPIYKYQRIDLYKAYKKRGWIIPDEFLEYDENGKILVDPSEISFN